MNSTSKEQEPVSTEAREVLLNTEEGNRAIQEGGKGNHQVYGATEDKDWKDIINESRDNEEKVENDGQGEKGGSDQECLGLKDKWNGSTGEEHQEETYVKEENLKGEKVQNLGDVLNPNAESNKDQKIINSNIPKSGGYKEKEAGY